MPIAPVAVLLHSWLMPAPLLALTFEDFLRGAVQLLVVMFFFGGPLLRRGKGQGEAAPGQPADRPRRARRSAAETTGEDLWKQLMEGIEPQQRPTPPQPTQARANPATAAAKPKPSAAAPSRGASNAPRAPAATRPPPFPGAPTQVRPAAASGPLRSSAARSAEPSAPEALGTELAPEALNDIQFAEIDEEELERNPDATVKPIAAGSGSSSAGSEAAPIGAPPAPVHSPWGMAGTDWRRALVLAEVLGPPVTLRGGGGSPLSGAGQR